MIKEIIESGNWEKLLYYIVEEEQLDPWNLDISILADKFIEYVRKAQDLDFRIPAKVLYIAVFLLKLKLETLFPRNQEIEEEIREILELPTIDLSNLEISLPIKRLPISQITLENLINALRQVLILKEKKEERKERLKKIKEGFKFEEINYEEIIENVYKKISEVLSQKEKMLFDELIDKDDKFDKYLKFFSILSLEMRSKISTYQEDFLKEIYIFKNKIKEVL
ncbi:MAG: segregation/condensation protein A [Candidatus Aenigmatarchaeota archaeon]